VPEDPGASEPAETARDWLDRIPAVAIGAALVGAALLVYWFSGYDRIYNHFVLQAIAFLDGRADIPTPAYQDVLPILGADGQPTGRGLLPFPPLPAVVLMPFVVLWGVATDERQVSAVLGAIDVGLAWWVLGRLAVSRRIRIVTTIFFGFGTVFFYAAQLGTTWFFAHVVAVAFVLLAVEVALEADPGADEDVEAVSEFMRGEHL